MAWQLLLFYIYRTDDFSRGLRLEHPGKNIQLSLKFLSAFRSVCLVLGSTVRYPPAYHTCREALCGAYGHFQIFPILLGELSGGFSMPPWRIFGLFSQIFGVNSTGAYISYEAR
jgi:hypothetical protein